MTQAELPFPRIASPSPTSRAALLAYFALIVYASWYPFSGWKLSGLTPWTFLTLQIPQYWTVFDALVNVVGYIPFGLLLVLAMHPHVRGKWAFLLASLIGVLVSGCMEAVQTWLPRVPSNLDFLTNGAGAIIGALIGVTVAPSWLEQSRLYQLRDRWFANNAGQGLVLLALWPLAQIYPQAYLFGHGQLLPIFSEWLSDLLEMEIDLVAMLRPEAAMTAEQYWLSETIITACGLVGAVLTLLCLMRRGAPRVLLVAVFALAALVVKAVATAILFTTANTWAWVTPGAEGGFLIGALMLAGLAFAPQVAQRRVAILALLIGLLVVNTIPVNPYFSSTLQGWVQGKFLNFNGAAQFLALMWPIFALWYLGLSSHKLNR